MSALRDMLAKVTGRDSEKTFGTFAGVFTPTTLTIVGVIMYIRQPWVVGNAGVLGAIGIVMLAVTISATTALSLSSITTNVRIGSGGAFSLISKSLGLEIGGAIGIPFYFAQAVAVAMYIFGFREGLQTIVPDINPLLLDLAIYVMIVGISFISTSFAFRIQFVILAIIGASLISIFGSLANVDLHANFQLFGEYPGSPENGFKPISFWIVFAVFFPAVTGVMAGANMSGDLKQPRRSIPLGTLTAVAITTVLYIALVFVAAWIATPQELVSNYNIFIEKSLWPELVLAGLLGATFSSAIGSFVGAPRILFALGEKNILPKSDFLATRKRGEPQNAMMVTAIVVLLALSSRNLNTIAPMLTMFFMITYGMINIVALIEQALALPSYRPTLKIPMVIPVVGAVGCIVVMFIINAIVAFISIVLIAVFYFYLVRMHVRSEVGDSRSGLFTAVSEWAMKKTTDLSPKKELRSWRPDLLVPTSVPREVRSSFKLVESIVSPKGSIKFLCFTNDEYSEQLRLEQFIEDASDRFSEIDVPNSYTFVSGEDFNNSANIAMQSLSAAFFKPNVLFCAVDLTAHTINQYERLVYDAYQNGFGAILYIPFGNSSLAIEHEINLWLKNIPKNWQESFDIGDNDLAVLAALLIRKNWKGHVKVNIVSPDPKFSSPENLEHFNYMVRFPMGTTFSVITPANEHYELTSYHKSDLNIFPATHTQSLSALIELVNQSRVSAIFCYDSGFENVLV